ncbi:hypothetical protein KQI63_16460 [bacterium]|nr:hypothetical protein [bacterium]
MIPLRLRILPLIALLITLGFGTVSARAEMIEIHLEQLFAEFPDQPNDTVYTPGSEVQQIAWRECIASLLDGDLVNAESMASIFGYMVVTITDGDAIYVLLERDPDAEAMPWGVFALRNDPPYPYLMLQAPHALYDFRTGPQAIHAFAPSGATALYINGTHRCSSPYASPCDGVTSVCSGEEEPFRESDQAHAADGPLQGATLEMLDFNPGMVFLQLHGFSRLDGDPHIILSNGTPYTPSGFDWVRHVRDSFIAQDDTLTFKTAHIDPAWERFVGFTNTQGRLINGSSDACDLNPDRSTGQFIHMEQSYDGLRDNIDSWLHVAEMINVAFGTANAVEPERIIELPESPVLVHAAPNPFNASTRLTLSIQKTGSMRVEVFDLLGRRVATLFEGKVKPGEMVLSWQPEQAASARYHVRVSHEGTTIVHPLVYVK